MKNKARSDKDHVCQIINAKAKELVQFQDGAKEKVNVLKHQKKYKEI